MARYDAILVPGGGIHANGDLPPWVKNRFDRALTVRTEEYIIPLSAGTVHKPPPLDSEGYPIFESVAGGRYLEKHGIPPDHILTETFSYDTIGNAYFARLIHVDPCHFCKLLIITSAFHMPRTEAIFRWIYRLPPTDFDLTFEVVPDEGIDVPALEARRAIETQSLSSIEPIMGCITSIEALHNWLFSEHGAYQLHRPRLETTDAMRTY